MSLRRNLNLGFGAARVAFGLVAVAVPERMGRSWIGEPASSPRTQVILRALGGRDVALGAGTIDGSLKGRPRPWLVASTAADLGDLTATLAGAGDLDRKGVLLTSVIAGSAALAGALLLALDQPEG